MKGNLHFRSTAAQILLAPGDAGPTPLGKLMARAGPIDARRAVGNVIKPSARPADQFQPRLVAGAACLVVIFENLCVFSAPMCLWER
jgi:hypothetical protein